MKTEVAAPAPIQQAVDPNLTAEQTQAQQASVAALQAQAQGDTASLLARYGTRLALSGMAAPSNPGTVAAVAK